MNAPASIQPHAKMLRTWQLAILRFAVTHDNADRLNAIAIAGELDALGRTRDAWRTFSYFRKTSADLCAAILQPSEAAALILREYIARIDDIRLKRAFTAVVSIDAPEASLPRRTARRDIGLWRGLPARRNSSP